ncbi:ATP-dependent DNA ligase (plasmid) [Alkalihalophilus pseudofirmus OF4]|uniref:ATP-dependent DNA ligase n=1 Tax=Alkalihalophilus pseudofirmus (strain ATCC BAA-2126 / JCM 17055 / OF4) TaxID=398511 RepID=D3G0Z1_ALKPO|nr:ATP-dependent DNA ligase [Alkalihalophilus pseudofirmus OF4]
MQQIEIEPGTVLDGELIVTDKEGKPDFEAMMRRFQTNLVKDRQQVQYVVFDVIYRNNQNVSRMPLVKRKELLADFLGPDTELLAQIKYVIGYGKELYDAIKQEHLEGIVQKQAQSVYEIGKRSHSWLKVIDYNFAEVMISGYLKNKLGWLLQFDNGVYAGMMELGIPSEAKNVFYSIASQLITREKENVVYIEPIIQCKVKYRNMTSKGLLRLPSFVEFIIQ